MSKIISIHSYRGGTGKSNATANLAAILACQGKRVAIVDTDLPSPGIHILFELQDKHIKYTLNDFLWQKCKINESAYDVTSVLGEQKTEKNLIYLVPASVQVSDISRILRQGFNTELLLEGIEELIQLLQLDYLFLDTHPGLNRETLLSLTISNIVLLFLTPDEQDLRGTAVTLDVASRLKVPKLFLVVNKIVDRYNFGELRQQIESTHKIPIVGMMPDASDMLQLASKGLFVLKYPNHPISLVLKQIAEQIDQQDSDYAPNDSCDLKPFIMECV
ncbi:MAG: MinD/ParA family protein [Microcystis sp. M54BS1]|jgi:MinD-like ATPase involved in chromosome partitioning or flagellar assembly|uniref:MinD/ParA family protein n=2 Tax=Microcystis TaxID=1125 RepID=A0A551XE62_MICAE|nr:MULTISPECIES: MinD/ParA family protein [Microcystis]MBE5230195.1 MinD/ParA family protein [Microcystis aeruginosa PMC 728.11]MCA2540927.1 MinD/ParA family protein [Microcystis sp. M54BS1]MCA2596344.1 MinD/ParA family protein [Microcystis sp. M38BS1]MCA2612486.1 MinD/ParA family protein [Microcystis sp. M27BS1]NCS28128.1 MinD/ParA family protein [Microcystis aeruginosa F13-15]TRT46968.1 MAG: MinD/ParA family protein [Microcystis aeruginosa Ma_QC_C_20070703_M131]